MEDFIKQEYDEDEMYIEEYQIAIDEEAEELHEAAADDIKEEEEAESDINANNEHDIGQRKFVYVQDDATSYHIIDDDDETREQQSSEADDDNENENEMNEAVEAENEINDVAKEDENVMSVSKKEDENVTNVNEKVDENERNASRKRKIVSLQDSNFEYFNKRKHKKKDREYEEKRKVALEVTKYPFVYDVLHSSFNDKALQQATWQKIAAAVGFTVDKCQTRWHSLKRSARYYATEKKIPAGQHYSHKWPFRDFMKFYTPPSLRDASTQLFNHANGGTTATPQASGVNGNASTSTVRSNASGPPPRLRAAPSHVFNHVSGTAPPPTLRPAPSHIFNRENSAASPPALSRIIEVVNPTSPLTESVDFFNDEVANPPQPPQSQEKITNEQLSASITTMANTFVAYLQSRSVQTRQQQARDSAARPPLKYLEMWTNFDRLVSKLDEDVVDDLNIEITQLIGAALKRKRNNEVIID